MLWDIDRSYAVVEGVDVSSDISTSFFLWAVPNKNSRVLLLVNISLYFYAL